MAQKGMVNAPEILDAPTLRLVSTPPAPRSRKIDLKTLGQVRREMSKTYRDARAGIIKPEDGSRFAFMLASIGKVIEGALLEQRVVALEQDVDRE